MNTKKILAALLALAMLLCLAACASDKEEISEIEQSFMEGEVAPDPVLTVYAPESSVLFLATAMENFDKDHPDITVTIMYSDSVDNAEKVMSGYDCDIFVTDYAYLIDFIDIQDPAGVNTYGLDFILEDSRRDICTADIEAADGSDTTLFTAAVLKSSASPDAAKLFIQYLTDMDASVYAEYGYTKVN